MTALEIALALSPCHKASAQLNTLISLAELETGTVYGTQRPKAVALLALHWIVLAERGRGGAAGQLTAEVEGDLSRSHAALQATKDLSLSSTSWGLELIRCRNACIMGMRTRMDFFNGN